MENERKYFFFLSLTLSSVSACTELQCKLGAEHKWHSLYDRISSVHNNNNNNASRFSELDGGGCDNKKTIINK